MSDPHDARNVRLSVSELEERLLRSRVARGLFGGGNEAITLGRFELVRVLGRGGMGVVYEAIDRECDASVALKALVSADAHGVARIKREFRSLAELVHPNLVCLHQLFHEDEQWFFTMELVAGVEFDAWVAPAGHAFDATRLRDALLQLADALDAVHRAGKLHCDLKPSNVLVTGDGRVVVLDFGLVTDRAERVPNSNSVIAGTPGYMAPELAVGSSPSTASDWYAVGVMTFHALTGALPFVGNPAQVLVEKRRAAAPDPRSYVPALPAPLCAMCEGLLEREPERRWGATQVRDALRAS